jgi:hypothetical protein
MKKEYALILDKMLWRAFGIFTPGSNARAIREKNYALGMRTCGYCLQPYRSRIVLSDGQRMRLGRGVYYCSRAHYRDDLAERHQGLADYHGIEVSELDPSDWYSA